jgi:hypothetical protein
LPGRNALPGIIDFSREQRNEIMQESASGRNALPGIIDFSRWQPKRQTGAILWLPDVVMPSRALLIFLGCWEFYSRPRNHRRNALPGIIDFSRTLEPVRFRPTHSLS